MTDIAHLVEPVLAAASNLLLMSVIKPILLLPPFIIFMRIALSSSRV